METILAENLVQSTLDCFWDTVPPVWKQVREHIHTIATQEFDITFEQFHVLRHIRNGVHSVSDLATANRVSRPAVSQAVDVLVNKGLVSRGENTADRRFVKLELTPQGAGLLEAILDASRAWMVNKLAQLAPDDLKAISRGLSTLKTAFNAQAT